VLNVLSLFDGMSCGKLALDKLKIKYDNYFASEIDKTALLASSINYPDTIQLGDVTQLDTSKLPKIDLLIGGSPCQGFSIAGKKLNFNDPRSALFFEYLRILNELKPKWFLLENVRMAKEPKETISNLLGVDPVCIDSAQITAAYRKRLYWTNIPFTKLPKYKLVFKDIKSKRFDKDLLWTDKHMGIFNKRVWKHNQFYRVTEDFKKVACVQAPTSKTTGSTLKTWVDSKKDWLRYLTIEELERCQTVPNGFIDNLPLDYIKKYRLLGNGWTVDVICHLLSYLKNV
jgi:site-specific DNA-cytosine methylase